jgi:hypothetical protein
VVVKHTRLSLIVLHSIKAKDLQRGLKMKLINVLSKTAPVYFSNGQGFAMKWVTLENGKIVPVCKLFLAELGIDKTGLHQIEIPEENNE